MKKFCVFIMVVIGLIGTSTMNAQGMQMTDEEITRDIIGTWVDQEILRSSNDHFLGKSYHEIWAFNADGTLTIKRTSVDVKWEIAGYLVNFDLYQERVEKKWSINAGKLEYTHIPLRNLVVKVKNLSISEYGANVQQKIKAAIPEFEKNTTRDIQLDWEKVVGAKGYYDILSYSKNKLNIKFFADNQAELVLIRDIKGYLDSKVTNRTGTLNGHDYVDLGLPSGTLWATCNVGAESYNQNGSYYAYGETMPKQNYTEGSYKFYLKQNGNYYLKKYCSSLNFTTSYDYVDGKNKLDPIDDVAHVKWGGDWRIPTEDELRELVTKCKWEKLNDGAILTGPNGNSIFLPAAGFKDGTKLYGGTCKGCYMSNTNNTADPGVYGLNLNTGEVENSYIYKGYSVRPVNTSMVLEIKKKKELEQASLDQEYFRFLTPEIQQSVKKAKSMGIEMVDLGLSVRWANMNLGARKPEDRGDRYEWGGVEPKYGFDGRNNTKSDRSRLDETCDPATIKIGAGFHVPTEGQWNELFERCEIRQSDSRGGLTFIGPNGNSIFVPYSESDAFLYWTCEGYGNREQAIGCDIVAPRPGSRSLYRWGLNLIRPVLERNEGFVWDQFDKKVSSQVPDYMFAKKWFESNEDGYDEWCLSPDGTIEWIFKYQGEKIPFVMKFKGNWIREKGELKVRFKECKHKVDPIVSQKLSEVERNEMYEKFEEDEEKFKKSGGHEMFFEILKVDYDNLVMESKDNGVMNFISERQKNNLYLLNKKK